MQNLGGEKKEKVYVMDLGIGGEGNSNMKKNWWYIPRDGLTSEMYFFIS